MTSEKIKARRVELKDLRQTAESYPHAARVIAVHLNDFCNRELPYDEMIADAARKAG